MKVVILTCYESNEERVSFVFDACTKRKYDISVITTDFSHIKKARRNNIPKKYDAIKTKPYIKNLSLERIISHIYFARDAFKKVEDIKPDLIWLMAPANSLIRQANAYKKNHSNIKLIIDIIDMWPESLPINISKNVFPFLLWKNIRTNNINCADALVSECDFYQDILAKEYHKNIKTIRWSKDQKISVIRKNLPKDKLSLCYIGSINNIISTDIICKIIKNINMPVVLHVIGEGENRYNFILENNKYCEVVYHGVIRDEKKKTEIFSKCHAGINIYRNNLYIGLTVKCIDYFANGLPIINNIKGDTWQMVEKHCVGINVDENSKLNGEDLIVLRKNSKKISKFYNDHFTKEVFINRCLEVIDEAIK